MRKQRNSLGRVTGGNGGRCARGFTIVEFSIAMVVTALVLSALAGFAMAVSRAWQDSNAGHSALLTANHDAAVLMSKIRGCRLIGAYRTGSLDGSGTGAALLLWKDDTNGDGSVNWSEMLVIEHDPASGQLMLYQPTSMGGGDPDISYSGVFSQASNIDNIVGLSGAPTVMIPNVTGAEFFATPSNSSLELPTVEFVLNVSSNGVQQLVYGDATLRAPLAVPTN